MLNDAPNRVAGETGNGHHGADEPPAEAFHHAMSQIGELKAYASQYVAAKLAGLKVSIRRAVFFAAMGVIALLAGGAMIVTAGVLIVVGLSRIFGILFGGNLWAGELFVGVGLLSIIGLTTWLVIRQLFKASRKATVESYERRIQQQRVELGHTARERSAQYARSAGR